MEPTLCAENASEVLERVTAGAAVQVPLSAIACGDPLALSLMEIVPVRAPVAVGIKVTDIVQLAETAIIPPQLLVAEKSPVAKIDVIVTGTCPVFASVTLCAPLVEPTCCDANVRLIEDSVIAGAAPVPVSCKTCGEFP